MHNHLTITRNRDGVKQKSGKRSTIFHRRHKFRFLPRLSVHSLRPQNEIPRKAPVNPARMPSEGQAARIGPGEEDKCKGGQNWKEGEQNRQAPREKTCSLPPVRGDFGGGPGFGFRAECWKARRERQLPPRPALIFVFPSEWPATSRRRHPAQSWPCAWCSACCRSRRR